MWQRIWCAGLLLLLALAAGCGGQGQEKTHDRGTIGVSVLTLNNPFFKVIGDTITKDAGEHGYKVIVVSGDNMAEKQHDQVKDFIVKGVAAIVLCPCDSRAVGPAIEEANKADIPVFTADIGCVAPKARVKSHIATDNYGGGKQAAYAVIEALRNGGGKVAILDYRDVESCQKRVKGFREVIDAHNRKAARKIEIVKELPCGGDKDRGYKAAADALQAHQDLKAIFAINDPSALGARTAVEEAKRADEVKIVGFDGQRDGKLAIKEGKIYADPIQFPDKIGHITVATILKYFNAEDFPREQLIPTELYRQADALKDKSLE
jgi:ribose transport system substrate-binding protein